MSFSDRAYGRIYLSGASTAQTLHATPGTFSKISGFTTAGLSYGSTPTGSTTDNIVLSGAQAQVCRISWSITFTVGAAGLFSIAPYVATVVIPGAVQSRTGATSTTYTVSGTTLYLPAALGETLELRAASDQVSPTFTPTDGWLEFHQ
jgi:hypothetical protein